MARVHRSGGAPFFMPDGSRLSAFLRADEPLARERRKRAPKQVSAVEAWRASRVSQALSGAWGPEDIRAAEAGQRRQRRWDNERVLLALCGSLTLGDMEAQFRPPPFGIPHEPSPFEMLLSPDHAQLLLAFLSGVSDGDAFPDFVAQGKQSGMEDLVASGDSDPLRAWERVPRSGRRALAQVNVSSEWLCAVENHVRRWVAKQTGGEDGMAQGRQEEAAVEATGGKDAVEPEEIDAPVQAEQEEHQLLFRNLSGFGRLLIHNLAAYYSLASHSIGKGATRDVCLTHKAGRQPCLPLVSCVELLHLRGGLQKHEGGAMSS